MNEAQTEAIAQADAELSNAALPTYSELLEALRSLKSAHGRFVSTDRLHEPSAVNAYVELQASILSRIPA